MNLNAPGTKIYKPISLFLVLLLHSSILWQCSTVQIEPPPPQGTPKETDYLVRDIVLLNQDKSQGDIHCKDTYRGIGIEVNWGSNEITEVAPNGPAAKIGIKVGDVLTKEEIYKLYDKGTPVVVEITRNGIPMKFYTEVDDICYEY